jgi:hypothetical protein
VLAVVALIAAGAVAGAEPADPNQALAREQLTVAREALHDLDQLHKNGEVSFDDPRFAVWMRREVEAIRASGGDQAGYIAALEGYVKRMKELERAVQTAYSKGQASRPDLHEAKYRTLEAQIWLNRERSR